MLNRVIVRQRGGNPFSVVVFESRMARMPVDYAEREREWYNIEQKSSVSNEGSFVKYVLFFAILGLLAASAVFSQQDGFKYHLNAQQVLYRDGVPHIDSNGKTRMKYDAKKSFLPILLYHCVNTLDAEGKILTPLDVVRKAGFNGVHTNRPIDMAFMDRLQANGLKMVKCGTDESTFKQFAKHPAILGWDVFDEPDGDGEWQSYSRRMEIFEKTRKIIRKYDKTHPVFVNQVAWTMPPNGPFWAMWQHAGDISCHDNYPITTNRPQSLSGINGIPESVTLANMVNNQKKPVWLILQTFKDSGRWAYPTPAEIRSMVYASIVHGATGIDYFMIDNYVGREGDIIGMSPTPMSVYPGQKSSLKADDAMMRKMKEMWDCVAEINHEIEQLTPYILSPTSQDNFKVYIKGDVKYDSLEVDGQYLPSRDPIRALLKERNGKYVMMVVNLNADKMDVRVQLTAKNPVESVTPMFENRGSIVCTSNTFQDSFDAFAVHVYEFSQKK